MTETVRELRLDLLPEEVLLEVFRYLGAEDLCSTSQVNSRLNGIIENSPKALQNLRLVIDLSSTSWTKVFQQVRSTARKYPNLKINEASSWNRTSEKVLRKLSADLRYLEITCCELDSKITQQFVKTFKSLKNLESLKIEECEIDDFEDFDNFAVDLPKLKSVTLFETHSGFLKFLLPNQLKSLKVRSNDSICEMHLVDFLCSQKNLEELALLMVGGGFGTYSVEKFSAMTFPLKKLSLIQLKNEFKNEQILLAFFNNFSNTLEELEIKTALPKSVYQLIFKSFRKLKTLRINIKHAPEDIDNDFYRNLTSNLSISKLIIEDSFIDSNESVKGIIGSCPNVQVLVLEFDMKRENLLPFISNNLRQLHTLHLRCFHSNSIGAARMPLVKTLSTSNLHGLTVKDWKLIVKTFPNVESFTAGYSSESFNDRIFNVFTKSWKKLKSLRLGSGFTARKRIFNQLLANCKQISTFELSADAFKTNREVMIKDFKKDGLRLMIRDPAISGYSVCSISNFFGSLWKDEELDEFVYDSDSDDDEMDWMNASDDFDSDDNFHVFAGLMQFALGRHMAAPTDSDEEEFGDDEMHYWGHVLD